MANLTTTNNDIGSVTLRDGEFRNDTLTFTGAATIAAGTILARDSVSLKLVPFVKGGVANENGIPKVIAMSDVVATGAGDLPTRVAVSGAYRKERLIIDADGDDSNIDAAVIDQLRDYGIVPINVDELNILDNQ